MDHRGKMVGFGVIRQHSPDDFNRVVKEKMKEGWTIYGDLHTQIDSTHIYYIIPVAKFESEEE